MSDAPLPPAKIAEIESLLKEVNDPNVRIAFRERLFGEAQAAANADALNRRRYHTALTQAQLRGDPDPEVSAAHSVIHQRWSDLHDERVRAIFKRVDHGIIKRRDKSATKAEKASKSAKPATRRLPQRDRQYLEIVGTAEKEGYLGDVPLVLSILNSKIPNYRLPHWEKTTISLKVMAMSSESSREGAQTINLRLNSVVCGKALASPRGPASYMQDAIKRAFDKTFGKGKGPDFWFVIETDTNARFHLHGAVVTPNMADAVDMVDAALRTAGGKWESDGGHQHQQVTRSLDDPLWWAFYAVKRMNIGGGRISSKLFASTRELRSRAEINWDDLRSSLPQEPRASRA